MNIFAQRCWKHGPHTGGHCDDCAGERIVGVAGGVTKADLRSPFGRLPKTPVALTPAQDGLFSALIADLRSSHCGCGGHCQCGPFDDLRGNIADEICDILDGRAV